MIHLGKKSQANIRTLLKGLDIFRKGESDKLSSEGLSMYWFQIEHWTLQNEHRLNTLESLYWERSDSALLVKAANGV